MPQQYIAQCECGNHMIIESDENLSFLRVVCGKCGILLINHVVNKSIKNYSSPNLAIPQQKRRFAGLSDNAPTMNTSTLPLSAKKSMVTDTKKNIRFDVNTSSLSESPLKIDTELYSSPEKQTMYIGQYKILKQLGSGSMGKVYLGIDENTNEQVALKVINKNSDVLALDYFLRETQVLLSLHHPNIVALKGWGNYEGSPFIAMEYVSGITLEELLVQQKITIRYAIEIMVSVLDALNYVHNYHIVHRDIKPTNIIIGTKNKSVKLIDFGIGKELEDQTNLTRTGQIVGTVYYMAPEQLHNAKDVDYRADIYAVGATLYHTLSHQPPFIEHGKNMVRVLMAKRANDYIRLDQKNMNISSKLAAIVDKAMAFHPQSRYSSALEMQKMLMEAYKDYVGEH
ncbi:MAG: serine/threonine protein kinase [Planctomycetes bacterium]|jgi:serine/threonine protein kinase|nr:serine/threonine protein kinase [Planctomycetota bacterium]HPY75141.1 serine/threonine-protein kinase [Planctomycetota bacterium]HQB00748.1 serine/threonine-protein kinase [Planctomycetota bacterium]